MLLTANVSHPYLWRLILPYRSQMVYIDAGEKHAGIFRVLTDSPGAQTCFEALLW